MPSFHLFLTLWDWGFSHLTALTPPSAHPLSGSLPHTYAIFTHERWRFGENAHKKLGPDFHCGWHFHTDSIKNRFSAGNVFSQLEIRQRWRKDVVLKVWKFCWEWQLRYCDDVFVVLIAWFNVFVWGGWEGVNMRITSIWTYLQDIFMSRGQDLGQLENNVRLQLLSACTLAHNQFSRGPPAVFTSFCSVARFVTR